MTTASDPVASPSVTRSPRAEQILDAAQRLIIKQGFKGVTMATVAARAHVGKGTAYQYWRTKEELFLELVARELAELQADLADQIRTDRALARPENLCPAVIRSAMSHPLVRALQISDDDVLGALLDDPRSESLLTDHGAAALLHELVPVWRRHGVIGTDLDAPDQVDALGLLALGSFAAEARRRESPASARIDVTAGGDPGRTLRVAIGSMLSTSAPTEGAAEMLAEAVAEVLDAHAASALAAVG